MSLDPNPSPEQTTPAATDAPAQAGDPGQAEAPAAAEQPTTTESTAPASSGPGVGDLVSYEHTDAGNGSKSTRYGVVIELWEEPVTDQDGNTADKQLARVSQLADAGVVPADDLSAL